MRKVFILTVLFILLLHSLFASDDFENTENEIQYNSEIMNVAVVTSTSDVHNLSDRILQDLKKYCKLFFIEDYTDRAYINSLKPQREYRNEIKKYRDLINSSNYQEATKQKEVVNEKYEIYKNNTDIFYKNINDGIKDVDIVSSSYYTNEFVFEKAAPIKYSVYNITDFSPRALYDESKAVARIICNENNFDVLVIPSAEVLSSVLTRLRLKIYSFPDDEFVSLYDKIIPTFEIQQETQNWILLLSNKIGVENYALYDIEERDYVIGLNIDGEKADLSGLVIEGEHTVIATSPGRDAKTFIYDFKGGIINKLSIELEKQEFDSLLIRSVDTNASAFMFTEKGEYALPQAFDKYKTPYSYSISALGFLDHNSSLLFGSDHNVIDINLRPEWVLDKGFIDEGRKNFYTCVTAVAAVFALNITSRAFASQNNNATPIWNSIDTISVNAMYSSVGFLFGFLVDYFIRSKNSLF